MQPGSIVRCRNREWVVLPADSEEIVVLRPLTGTPEDAVCIHRHLMNLVGGTLPFERVEPTAFPWPSGDHPADATSTLLLWQAARLILREGATPFRSLGRLSREGLLLLPLEVQLKLYRAWTQIIGERLFWLDSMFADLLEQRGAENVASAMALVQQRYPA